MPEYWPAILVTPEIVARIAAIGAQRRPQEACGILLGFDHLVELPNTSEDPEHAYVIARDAIVDAIQLWYGQHGPIPAEDLLDPHPTLINLIVWHTHPNGFVGPSRGDMQCREDGCKYLVVSLPGPLDPDLEPCGVRF
jgi:proteasome lid subunit RPN8/RPN11